MNDETTTQVREDLESGLPPEEPRQQVERVITPRVVQQEPASRGRALDARFYDFCTMRDGHPDVDKLVEALALAQTNYESVKAEYTARVESRRTGGKYEYDYADLAAFIDVLRPKLAAQGVAFFQLPLVTERAVTVKTVLAKANQMLWNYVTVPVTEPGAQAIGSATTYAKRYGLGALTGIAAEKDDDGEAADRPQARPAPPQPAQRRSQQPATGDAAADNTALQDTGHITECTVRQDGVTVIRTSTNLRAFTRDRALGRQLSDLFKATLDGRPKSVRVTAGTEPGVQVPVVIRVEEV